VEKKNKKKKRDRQQQKHKGDPVMTYAISVVLCTKNDMAHQTNKYETGDTGFDMDLKNA